LWQQRDFDARKKEYIGHKAKHSLEMASLDDGIKIQALAPEIQVREMMETEQGGGTLCYRY
jgi:tyrosinase